MERKRHKWNGEWWSTHHLNTYLLQWTKSGPSEVIIWCPHMWLYGETFHIGWKLSSHAVAICSLIVLFPPCAHHGLIWSNGVSIHLHMMRCAGSHRHCSLPYSTSWVLSTLLGGFIKYQNTDKCRNIAGVRGQRKNKMKESETFHQELACIAEFAKRGSSVKGPGSRFKLGRWEESMLRSLDFTPLAVGSQWRCFSGKETRSDAWWWSMVKIWG